MSEQENQYNKAAKRLVENALKQTPYTEMLADVAVLMTCNEELIEERKKLITERNKLFKD